MTYWLLITINFETNNNAELNPDVFMVATICKSLTINCQGQLQRIKPRIGYDHTTIQCCLYEWLIIVQMRDWWGWCPKVNPYDDTSLLMRVITVITCGLLCL